MDIRPSRPATTADQKTTTQTQKNQSDSSLLYRMAIRTMLEDLETAKKKSELAAPPLTKSTSTSAPASIIIPVPLPPAYLASPTKTTPLPPVPPIKTETTKIATPIPPAPPIASTAEATKDELTKTIEEAVAGKKSEKITEEARTEKETAIKPKEEQKDKEEEKKRREVEALKIKEEQQKAKEGQKAAQQAAREEAKKIKAEEKLAKELAAKTARELRLAEETEKRETAKKLQEEVNKDLEQAQLDYEAGAYEAVIELAQKILASGSISWFLKLKVKRIIKDATRSLRKKQIDQIKEATRIKDEENLKKIVASLPSSMPPITTQRTTALPPPNLPTLPGSSANIEDLQENSQEAFIPTPKNISPLLTELISESPSESESEVAESSPSLFKNKRILLLGASLVLVIILVGFGVWFANKNVSSPVVISPSKTPTISATPTPSRPAPEPLFAVDKQKAVTLKDEGQSLKESLLTFAKIEEPVGTFTALDIKSANGESLSLKEISQNLNLEIFSMPTQDCNQGEEDCFGSKTLEDLLDLTNFSLFVYSQNGSLSNSSSPFAAASSTNEGRLGLIISLKKQASSTSTQSIENQSANSLKDLETLLPKELVSLLLKTPLIPQIPAFSQASYKNAVIRYLNLPTPEIAIDYAILDNKLIFATSKESMLTIIDQLTTTSQAGGNL